MRVRTICAVTTGYVLLCAVLPLRGGEAQTVPPSFNSRAVESATTISGGVCSNPAIGISYRLPEGMKSEDATAMRMAAYAGSTRRGIGPVARYFLWGYEETKLMAFLCGAAGAGGQAQLIAAPLSTLQGQGPHPLQHIVEGLGHELRTQSSPPRTMTVNGLNLVCADVSTEVRSPVRGAVEMQGTSCAAEVKSYVVMWNLIGYSEGEWKRLVAGLDSVTIFAPQPLGSSSSLSPSTSNAPRTIAPDFQARLEAFLQAWLGERDIAKTMAFFDRKAYTSPPHIGTYCGGWYRAGARPKLAARFISQNLMGVPKEFPANTRAAAIFTAWNRLPRAWLGESANDVARDHFLVVSLDDAALDRIFSSVFAGSDYGKYIRDKVRRGKRAYWVVFPEVMRDGDLFVIFTLWQQTKGQWMIKNMDVVCQ